MCTLARKASNSSGFSSNCFLMEPLVRIPSLASFKGDRREGCKTQLRMRKKAPDSPCVRVWNLWFLWLPFLLFLFLSPVFSFTVLEVYLSRGRLRRGLGVFFGGDQHLVSNWLQRWEWIPEQRKRSNFRAETPPYTSATEEHPGERVWWTGGGGSGRPRTAKK